MDTSLILSTALFAASTAAAYFVLSATVLARRERHGLEGLAGGSASASRTVNTPGLSPRQALGNATREWRRFERYRSLEMSLLRAGWRLLPVEFLIALAVLAALAGAIAWAIVPHLHGSFYDSLRIPGWFAGAVAAAAVLILGPIALTVAQARRMARFELNLPDAMELMSASLRSGHGFQRALQVTAEDMPRPVSEEFALAVQDISLGNTVEDALAGIFTRVPSYEMELLTTAVGIQMQVGGNLSEILQQIAETLRERQRIKGEIATLTAEGKLSAIIVFAMPIFIFLWLATVSPDYIRPLLTNDVGRFMLMLAGVSELIGMTILWRMVSMEV